MYSLLLVFLTIMFFATRVGRLHSSCSEMAKICSRDSASSSHLIGLTAIWWKVNGARSMRCSTAKTLPSMMRYYQVSSLLYILPNLIIQIPQLQSKILAEGKVVGDKIKELIDDWTANKPVAGTNPQQV
jgi:hypothetical protein